MTIKEAEEIILKTKSPKLKRDMERFIKREKKGELRGQESRTTSERDKQNGI